MADALDEENLVSKVSRFLADCTIGRALWYTVSSDCLSVVCLSVTFCIVAKRYVLVKNCLKE